MNKVDLSDGRIVYEKQTVELQNYVEQAIASQNPLANDRVLQGLNYTLSSTEIEAKPHYSIKVAKGFGNTPKGFRVVLMEETTYEIKEPKEGFSQDSTLEFWLMAIKKAEGKWTDKKNKDHPERYLDSGYLVVTIRPKKEVEDPSQPAVRALSVLRGEEYLGKFVDPSEADLLRLFALNLAQDKSGVWTDSRYVAMIEDVAKPFLKMQEIMPLGSYHDQDIEHELFEVLNTWLSKNTRWRLANGQELPSESKLKRQGKTHIPNLNNRFKRSWGEEAQQLERKIGDTQLDAMQRIQGPTDLHIMIKDDFFWDEKTTQSYTSGPFRYNFSSNDELTEMIKFHYKDPMHHFHRDIIFDNALVARVDPKKDENRPINTMVATFYLT